MLKREGAVRSVHFRRGKRSPAETEVGLSVARGRRSAICPGVERRRNVKASTWKHISYMFLFFLFVFYFATEIRYIAIVISSSIWKITKCRGLIERANISPAAREVNKQMSRRVPQQHRRGSRRCDKTLGSLPSSSPWMDCRKIFYEQFPNLYVIGGDLNVSLLFHVDFSVEWRFLYEQNVYFWENAS